MNNQAQTSLFPAAQPMTDAEVQLALDKADRQAAFEAILVRGGRSFVNEIKSGRIDAPTDEGVSLETHFKRWRKEQSTRTLMIEVGADKLEAVVAAIKAAGGKVL